jgi:iron complex outermembrane receptor protein
MHRKIRFFLWAGSVASLIVTPQCGFAQADDALEEIVVTARKIEERLQDVPLAITAFGPDEIQQAGIKDLADIASLTPGLSFFNAVGGFLPTPVIRGVAQTDIFNEVNVGIFLDGVYVSGREGLNFSQLDLERIEVIKGPTSAKYGRNAFSGAINYITKRPTEEFELSGDVTAGNEGKVAGKTAVSGPLLGDTLLGRFAASYDEWDGSYDNPIPDGDDVGGYRYRSFKGNLLWKPAESFEAMLSAYYSNDEIDDSATVALQANCENDVDAASPNERFSNWCGDLPDLEETYRIQNMGLADDEIQRIPQALGENRELLRLSLNLDWDLGFGIVNALSGYFSTDQEAVVDGAFGVGYDLPFVYATNCALFDAASGLHTCDLQALNRLFTGLTEIAGGDETEEFSQELRFTSPLDRPVRFSVGGYYYTVDLDEYPTGLDATANLPADAHLGFFAPVSPTVGLAIGDFIFGEWFGPNGDFDPRREGRLETDSWAVFGSIEADFLERLTAGAEMRYTDEEKQRTAYGWDNPDLPPDQQASPFIKSQKDDWQFIAANAWLRLRISDDWQAYTSLGRNVKSGGFDQESVDYLDNDEADVIINPFDEEELQSIEVGIKGQAADGRLRIDMAMFRSDWSDVVLPILYECNPVSGDPNFGRCFQQPESLNDNAGDATVLGWEMGLEVAPTENWYTRFGISWTDASWDNAQLSTFEDFPSFAPDGDVTGKTVLRQPPWQFSGSVRYTRAVSGDWDYFSRLDVTWEDDWYVGNENQAVVPDHTNVNLRLGLKSPRYEIELWANNLLDNEEASGAFRQPYFTNTAQIFDRSDDVPSLDDPPSSTSQTIFPWAMIVSHPDLRTYGITVRAKFGAAAD